MVTHLSAIFRALFCVWVYDFFSFFFFKSGRKLITNISFCTNQSNVVLFLQETECVVLVVRPELRILSCVSMSAHCSHHSQRMTPPLRSSHCACRQSTDSLSLFADEKSVQGSCLCPSFSRLQQTICSRLGERLYLMYTKQQIYWYLCLSILM